MSTLSNLLGEVLFALPYGEEMPFVGIDKERNSFDLDWTWEEDGKNCTSSFAFEEDGAYTWASANKRMGISRSGRGVWDGTWSVGLLAWVCKR